MKKFYILTGLLFVLNISHAQVGIGTTSPDASSLLDIYASDKGILLPRVSLINVTDTQLDGTNTAATGLLIYNTNSGVTGGSGVGYYYYDGTIWIKLTSAVADHDFYEESTTTPPNDINDDIYTMGNVAIGKTTADYSLDISAPSTSDRAISMNIDGSGAGVNYISAFHSISGTGDGVMYGTYNNIANSGTGVHFGVFNVLNTPANGTLYGTYNTIDNVGSGDRFGTVNNLNAGTLRQIAISNAINSNSSSTDQTGVITVINGVGDGLHRGYVSALNGTGNGEQYGNHNLIANTGTGIHYGILNGLSGTGTGAQYGYRNTITNSGAGEHIGGLNELQGSGGGTQRGTYNVISNSGNGSHFGSLNVLTGTGTGGKFGFYANIPAVTGGTHYGLYSDVQKVGSYAGYFIGNVHVTHLGTFSIGDIGSGTSYTFPSAKGSADQILKLDSNDDLVWVNDDGSSAGKSSEIKALKEQLEKQQVEIDQLKKLVEGLMRKQN